MNTLKIDSTGWTLNVLAYGEQSPLENHKAFELGADDYNHAIWASEVTIRTYGLNSIMTACIAYANKRNKKAA